MTNLPVLVERKTVARRPTTALDVIQASNPDPPPPGVSGASVVGIALGVPAIAGVAQAFITYLT
jgi:hypothetical protein